jgi:MFS family permease
VSILLRISARLASGGIGILKPLGVPDFARLWFGTLVSMIGDGFYLVAVAWQVYDLSDSPAALAAVGIAWSLPQVLFQLATGALSDRLDRRHMMIAGDLLRLAAMAAVGVLSLTDQITIEWLVVLVFVYGIGQAVYGPAFTAMVPSIVGGELLMQANALGQFIRPFAMLLLGPLLGGLLVYGLGAGWAFIADALSFAWSALMVFRIRARPVERHHDDRDSLWEDAKVGVRFIRHTTWLWAGLLGSAISLVCVWGPWETLLPYVVKYDMHGSALALGLVFGAGGLGSVMVALTIGQRDTLPRKAMTIMYAAFAVAMLATSGFGVVTSIWQAAIVAFVAEGAITLMMVFWSTLQGLLVPDHLLGRVSSLDGMIVTAGAPLSFAAVGPLASAIGADATLIWTGVLGAVVIITFCLCIPGARAPERDGSLDGQTSLVSG